MSIIKKFKLFLSIAILFIALPTATPTYDFLKLSLQWPPTVVVSAKYRPNPMNFTIHGVWFNHFIIQRQPCPQAAPYAPITDPILLQRLTMNWPNLLGPDPVLWKHEWKEHGGCSGAVYNQTQYFKLGLELKDRYNVYELLRSNNLLGWTGPLNKINTAIRSGINKRAEFVCDRYRHPTQAYLMEIRICFDPNLVTIDCPRRVGPAMCPTGVRTAQKVYIPPP